MTEAYVEMVNKNQTALFPDASQDITGNLMPEPCYSWKENLVYLSILLCQVICTPVAAAEKINHAESE